MKLKKLMFLFCLIIMTLGFAGCTSDADADVLEGEETISEDDTMEDLEEEPVEDSE